MSTMSRMSAPIVVADLIEENSQLKARVTEFQAESRGMGAGLRLSDEKRRQAEARVAEIQAELTEAIKGRAEFRRGFDVQRSRVAELEEPQVGIVRCPNCDEEHTVSLSRGRTNDPNRPDKSGYGGSDGK